MRVLHVVPTYLPAVRYGGPIYSVHGLAKSLVHRGHQIDVVTTNVDGSGVSNVVTATPAVLDGVSVTYFPVAAGRRIYRSPEMGRHLKQHLSKFDVVHLHSVFLWPTTAAASAARAARVPYVISPRGMLVPELVREKSRIAKSAWIRLFERRNIASAAAVHATSELEAADIERMHLSPKRTAVIPNGIEIGDPLNGKLTAGLPSKPFALFLGRLSWKKGLDRLIRAIASLPGARLVVAGNDEEGYRNELDELCRSTDCSNRVHFVGEITGPQKWALLAAADVFVLPSKSENFGNAALEAMAMGTPVVVSEAVGLARTVNDTGAGLVTAGDVQSIARAIASLLSDEQRRHLMGEAGRRVAATEFSWDAVAQQMERLYSDILQGSKAAADLATLHEGSRK